MPSTMNRRQWLKFSSLTAAGLTLSRTCEAFPFELFPENILQNKNLVLLNQNENPYGISKKAEKAIVDAIRHSNRYPEDLMDELRSEIAKEEDVPKDHVMLAGGSTELYSIAGLVYGLGSKEILMASPTFFGFENYIRRIGSKMNLVPLDSDYKHDLNAMAKEVGSNTAMIYMCNPNNPTGTIVEGKKLRDFCESASKTAPVVVDEAYHYLVKDKNYSSMVDLTLAGKDVTILRTFSKAHGLAGLRVGYAITNPETIKKFKAIRTNFAPASALSLRAAIASQKDKEFLNYSIEKNAEVRSYLYGALKDLGYRHIPSHTNFVLFRINRGANDFVKDIQKHDVLVRPIAFAGNNYCRVSMGTMDETKVFTSALKKIT